MQAKSQQLQTTGTRIRMFGALKYPTVKAFADAMQMSASNLQLYMADKRRPGTPILTRLEAIGCNASWILTGEGDIIRHLHHATSSGRVEESQGAPGRYRLTVRPGMLDDVSDGLFMAGDQLVIDCVAPPEPGDYVVTAGENGTTLRRWRRGVRHDGLVVEQVRKLGVLRRSAGRSTRG
ncbi:hypothetical protein [Chlorobium sp. N1]|uniref:hypothetical protein n=1 Tax=Chlorobium sp. N1 TaxID=2491138 RepID=UPI00103DD96E|nr:hypothetical protein [Chlorobium sp. N1]TCD47690.1 hypothetical protein E0L29_05265 [Chlorobium sp. N1]